MNFDLTEDQRLLKKMVAKFSDEVIAPAAPAMDRLNKFDRALWDQLSELGAMGMMVDPKYGGSGLDTISCCLVEEEIARGSGALALSFVAHSALTTFKISKDGSDAQKAKFLPDLCSGKKIGALAMTEPQSGSDVFAMMTFAERKKDHYVLNGSKSFITNATIADTFVIYARTKKDNRPDAFSAFIVERGPGLTTGHELEKMGMRGSPTGEIHFDSCIIPIENLLGNEGDGKKILMNGLNYERTVISAISLGLAQAAYDYALRYAKERKQFDHPISDFQLIQAMLANMYYKINAARLLTHQSAYFIDQAKNTWTESAAAKLFAAEVGMETTMNAIQILGGYGYTMEYPVERYARDAKLLEIGAGTSEIMRMIIARTILQR